MSKETKPSRKLSSFIFNEHDHQHIASIRKVLAAQCKWKQVTLTDVMRYALAYAAEQLPAEKPTEV